MYTTVLYRIPKTAAKILIEHIVEIEKNFSKYKFDYIYTFISLHVNNMFAKAKRSKKTSTLLGNNQNIP